MKMTFRFEGGQELAKALNSLPPRVRGRMAREVLKEAAEPMRKRMGDLAPRGPDAPHIADHMVISAVRSIQGERTDEHRQGVAVGPARDPEFRNAIPQEFGTIHHPAQPFARPAFDQTAFGVMTKMRFLLWEAMIKRGLMVPGTGGLGDLGSADRPKYVGSRGGSGL